MEFGNKLKKTSTCRSNHGYRAEILYTWNMLQQFISKDRWYNWFFFQLLFIVATYFSGRLSSALAPNRRQVVIWTNNGHSIVMIFEMKIRSMPAVLWNDCQRRYSRWPETEKGEILHKKFGAVLLNINYLGHKNLSKIQIVNKFAEHQHYIVV